MSKFRKPKITIVVGSLERGGCETHLLQVMPALVALGYEVSVFLLFGEGVLADAMRASGVYVDVGHPKWQSRKVLGGRIIKLASAVARLIRHLAKHRPDIIHFFLPASYLIGAPVSLLIPGLIRVISRRSLNKYMDQKPWVGAIERKLHGRMDAILANSQAVLRDLVVAEHVNPRKVGVIYNGVARSAADLGQNLSNWRAKVGAVPDSLLICQVANLIPYKGHVDLFNALERLKDRDWKLVLAGRDDGHGDFLRRLATNTGLVDRICFAGPVEFIGELLEESDILVLPSHEEGFSNALLEGMLAGLPCVASNVGGNAEALGYGSAGILVPPKNPIELSEELGKLMDDSSLRRSIGEMARSRAQRKYSLQACIDQYDAFYTAIWRREDLHRLEGFKHHVSHE